MCVADDSKKEKLLNKMKRTRSNRFNCAKRFSTKAVAKSTAINILSLLCLVASIYLLAYSAEASPGTSRFVGVFIAGLSIVSMMLSLERSVSELQKRADQAHKCGREVSQLYGQLELDVITVSEAREAYEVILNSYDENHDPCDNWKTLYDAPKDFPKDSGGITWWRGSVLSWLSAYSPVIFALFCSMLVIAIWMVISWIVPQFALK